MTNRKTEILHHLYTFRFLSRKQIQILLHHKHFNRVIVWLNEMTDSGLLRKYYNPQKVTEPAIYSLGLKGRNYLKNHGNDSINPKVLDRVWREPKLSIEFRERCMLIADIYLSLKEQCDSNKATLHFYTKTQLKEMEYLIIPHPDAYIAIEESEGHINRYFLDIFDAMPPRMLLRKRTKQYLEYFEAETWQAQTDKPFPKIIFISPDQKSYNYLQAFIKRCLERAEEPTFYLGLKSTLSVNGLNSTTLTRVLSFQDTE